MFSSRPLQSPHCAMALKHVNQKAARCCWRQIVVTPLVPKQNAAGGPKVVTLTPLRSSAHRNAANGWCGSSLLLCLTHCIEVHDSYWIHGQILWQISHWDHKTWVNSTCDSISLRSTESNVVASKWHSSQLDTRLAKSCMFGQFCFYGSLCPDDALYSRIQERVTSEVEGVVNYKHHSSKRGFSYPLLLEDYLSCLIESMLQVSTLKSGTSGHLQSPTLGLQPYVLSSSIFSQGPCFALKK